MHPVVEAKRIELASLCKKHKVAKLSLFGSATGDRFDPAKSDIDILVEFDPIPTKEYADTYFGLAEDLERLFSRPIDLVEQKALRNPFLKQEIEETKVSLYDAKH